MSLREWCALGSVFFFFSSRRRHTRFKCDWSSDVCSSDLRPIAPVPGTVPVTGAEPALNLQMADRLTNARTRTSESINRGRFLYETYCAVCHGRGGRVDGPISSAAGGPFFCVRSLVHHTIARRSA